jgi:REP element-mobilizing transposase RayT
VREEVGRLRRGEVYAGARCALLAIAARISFRVVHLSIQHNHIHLLVEAGDHDALDSGMRALTISLARRINKSLGRSGKVFEYRYHSTPLTSPRQTRNAIAYVLNNWRRHREDERGLRQRTAILDPYSSAITFAGWADFRLTTWPEGYVALPVTPPQTWLLATGWELARRPIRTSDTPGPID